MANSTLPDLILLEDANDLCEFYEATNRTIPRHQWAAEIINQIRADRNEGLF